MSDGNVNTVKMVDGSEAYFGTRLNVKSQLDFDKGCLNFLFRTGEIINYTPEGLEGLNPFQAKVFLYGLLERVKNSLRGESLEELPKAVQGLIDGLARGEFASRAGGAGASKDFKPKVITKIMLAYVSVKALQGDEVAKGWLNTLLDVETIEAVVEVWEGFDKETKAKIRRNPHVKSELVLMEIEGIGEGEGLV